jgi:hypothetical protein
LKMAGVRPIDLVKALGVARPTASMMLGGTRNIHSKHWDGIAALLGVSLAELITRPHTPAHDDSVKKTYDVTSSVTEDGVQPLHPTVELGTIAGGDPIAPSDSSRLPEERVLDLHAIRDIINHARAIAAAVATLPAVADEPPAARGTGPGRSADDRPVRPKRTGTHHRR